MAVYKVIQDIESEDKLLGPLTLKGFVYAAVAALSAYIEFRLLFIASPIKWLFILLFLFPMALFGVLASPLGREQPTEVWLLSRIRYFLKPRQRVWDQEGLSELVTITVPKKEDLHLTKDLSQTEVQSRLKTLAQTLDTRGWAIKNADVNMSSPDIDANIVTPASDRLVGGAGVPQQMPVVEVHAADDILDEKNNPTAQKFEALMEKADAERKHGLLARLKNRVEREEPKDTTLAKSTSTLPTVKPASSKISKAKAKKLAPQKAAAKTELKNSRIKVNDQPLSAKPESPRPAPPAPPVTAANQTVNMELAQSGNAFSVATLSSLANRQARVEQTGPDEVTISLH